MSKKEHGRSLISFRKSKKQAEHEIHARNDIINKQIRHLPYDMTTQGIS